MHQRINTQKVPRVPVPQPLWVLGFCIPIYVNLELLLRSSFLTSVGQFGRSGLLRKFNSVFSTPLYSSLTITPNYRLLYVNIDKERSKNKTPLITYIASQNSQNFKLLNKSSHLILIKLSILIKSIHSQILYFKELSSKNDLYK